MYMYSAIAIIVLGTTCKRLSLGSADFSLLSGIAEDPERSTSFAGLVGVDFFAFCLVASADFARNATLRRVDLHLSLLLYLTYF